MTELLPEVYREGPAATLIRRDVITAAGPETEAFLQGQLSQDVAALAIGDAAPSFLLQPMGKVDAWLRVRRLADDAFALDVEEGHGDATLTRLNRFKLRTKSDLTLETQSVKAVRSLSAVDTADGGVPVDWGAISGYDVFGVNALDPDERAATAELDIHRAPPAARLRRRRQVRVDVVRHHGRIANANMGRPSIRADR